MIKIFGQTDRDFSTNGDIIVKPLKAKIKCLDNGDYNLSLETGLEYSDHIVEGNIVIAPTPGGEQAFRIGNTVKTKNKITTTAWHVFYDSKNYLIPSATIENKTCGETLALLNGATEPESIFTTSSDILTRASMLVDKASLYDAVQAVVKQWGGHLVRDNFSFSVMAAVGQDKGVTVQYRKNLKDISCSVKWDDVVTKLLPVGKDGVMLSTLDPSEDPYLTSTTQYDIPYTKSVSFSQNINREAYETDIQYTQALIADLRAQATVYLNIHCVPQVNYTLSANLDRISDIGDVIEVIDERLNIHLLTQVIGYEYDCILGSYTSIQFGNFSESISGLYQNILSAVKANTTSQISGAIDRLVIEEGETSGWRWRKYSGGSVEAWTIATIDDITWESFGDFYMGTFDVSLPFPVTGAVVNATIGTATDTSWVSAAKVTGNTVTLEAISTGNTGNLTVNLSLNGVSITQERQETRSLLKQSLQKIKGIQTVKGLSI